MKEKIDFRIIITVVICITAIEIFALYRGINGILLTTIIGILCAIAGITIPQESLINILKNKRR